MEEAHQQEMELWGFSHHGAPSEIMSGTISVLINHKYHLCFHNEMDVQALVFSLHGYYLHSLGWDFPL